MKKVLVTLVALLMIGSTAFAGPLIGIQAEPALATTLSLAVGWDFGDVVVEGTKDDFTAWSGVWTLGCFWVPDAQTFSYRLGVRMGLDWAGGITFQSLALVIGASKTWAPFQVYGELDISPTNPLTLVPKLGVNFVFDLLNIGGSTRKQRHNAPALTGGGVSLGGGNMQRRSKSFKRNDVLRYVTEYQGQEIGADEFLEKHERETSFNFSEGGEWFAIHTHTVAIMEGLLQCPQFKIIAIELALIKGTKEHPNKKRIEKVVGLKGRLPIGMLSLKTPRSDNEIWRIISPKIKTETPLSNVGLPRPRRDELVLKSTQIAGAHTGAASKKRRRRKEAESAWRRWVYGGERDPLLKGHSL